MVGGGTGGIVAANVLRKTLHKSHRVVLIDRNKKHVFYGSLPFLMINRRKPEYLQRELPRLNRKGIEFVEAEVTGINTGNSHVTTNRELIPYDYLILSPGAEHHPETVPGFFEGVYNVYSLEGTNKLRQRLHGFTGGNIVIFISSLPITCPPAPYEITFLLHDYLRKKGVRNQTRISLVSPEPGPEPLGGPKIGASIRKMLQERDICYYSEAKVLSLDTATRELKLDQGISLNGDLFMGVPSHWGPSFLRNTPVTEEGGWIKVNPYTLQTSINRVFATGDATNLRLPVKQVWGPKAGIFAHYQAEVVARNIALQISGKKPEYRYTAKGA